MTTENFAWSDALEDYALFGGRCQVEGWLDPGAIASTLVLAKAQADAGIDGPATEIGVHHGLYFILLELIACRGLAIDVFEDQHLNVDGSGHGDRARFEWNLRRFLPNPEAVSIEKADSLDLTAEDLLKCLSQERPRLFSIDGGHTAMHAEKDMRLAAQVCSEGAIIIIDDFENPSWPGVHQGIERFYAAGRQAWTPIGLGDNKLYIAHRSHARRFADSLGRAAAEVGADRGLVDVFGHPTRRVQFNDPWQVLPLDRRRALAADPANHCCVFTPEARPTFRLYSGWSQVEPTGVWSDGDRARLGVLVDEEADRSASLTFRVHAFARVGDEALRVRITSGGRDVAHWRFDEPDSCDRRIDLPTGLTAGTPWVDLDFDFDGVRSPFEAGLSSDPRKLGIALEAVHASAD